MDKSLYINVRSIENLRAVLPALAAQLSLGQPYGNTNEWRAGGIHAVKDNRLLLNVKFQNGLLYSSKRFYDQTDWLGRRVERFVKTGVYISESMFRNLVSDASERREESFRKRCKATGVLVKRGHYLNFLEYPKPIYRYDWASGEPVLKTFRFI